MCDLRLVLSELGGVAGAWELRDRGITRGRLAAACRRGDLVRLMPGVFLAAGVDPAALAVRLRIALAAAGPDAVLAHRTAAGIWGLRRFRGDAEVHVGVRPGRLRSLPGVVLHQLGDPETDWADGWPVTSVRRTLIGLASESDGDELRFPALAAVQCGWVTAADLADPHGVPRRSLGRWNMVAAEAAAGAESGAEGIYWRLLVDSRLPVPELNETVTGQGWRYRPDALWRELRLVAEIDGREHHTREQDFERDRVRQNRLHAAGFVIIRFPAAQLRQDPRGVLRATEENLITRAHDLGLPPPRVG